MPVIKSAIKKLRKDRKREQENDLFRHTLDRAVRDAKKQKTSKAVTRAVSVIDKAVKKNILHKNRAARMKSGLSKLSKPVAKTAKSPAKLSKVSKTTKKATTKSAKPSKSKTK